MQHELVRLSKFLSLVLRHKPEVIGLELDKGGWASVEELLEQTNAHSRHLTMEMLRQVVAENDKQRFAFSADETRIRASQGHSIPVDLGLRSQAPPDYLYHGTAARHLPAIREGGLTAQARHHVHLSSDEATARRVGSRHGRPVVLSVRASSLHQDGAPFYLSANGVWLVEAVPPAYLEFPRDRSQDRDDPP